MVGPIADIADLFIHKREPINRAGPGKHLGLVGKNIGQGSIHRVGLMCLVVVHRTQAVGGHIGAYAGLLMPGPQPQQQRLVDGKFVAGVSTQSIFIYLGVLTISGIPTENMFVPTSFNILPFFDALIVGLLWTFGLIIMLNQRLNADMSEAKKDLELIFNTSPDAAVITRLKDGRIVDISDGYCAISGYSRDEMTGKSSLEINIWKDIEDRNKVVKMLREKGSCENYEAVFVRKDGMEITGIMSAKVIDLQGVPHIISITRDITQRKKTEEALYRSEEKYRIMMEQAADSVIMHDQSGRIMDVNRKTCLSLDYTQEELLSMHIQDILPEATRLGSQTLWNKIHAGEQITFESRHIRKNGSVIPVEVTLGLLQLPSGPAFLGIVRDITVRKQAELELQTKMDELQRFHDLTVGRELTMIELKKEVNELLIKSGYSAKYKIVE